LNATFATINKQSHKTAVFAFCVFLISGLSLLFAQQEANNGKPLLYWLNSGAGISVIGPSYAVGFSVKSESSLFSVRYAMNAEFIFSTSPYETGWDAGVLYGTCKKFPSGMFSISSGLAVVGGVRRGKFLGYANNANNYESLPFSTMGIPLEAQLCWTPVSFLGLGVYAYADLNKNRSFAGVLLCLQVGNLR
jgi:hypothetical protein